MFQLTGFLVENADSSKWKYFDRISSLDETIICAPSRLLSHFARLFSSLPGRWYRGELFASSSALCVVPSGWSGHPAHWAHTLGACSQWPYLFFQSHQLTTLAVQVCYSRWYFFIYLKYFTGWIEGSILFWPLRCTGSPSERFILCLVIYICVSRMSRLRNIQGNKNVELSKSYSRKKCQLWTSWKSRHYLKEKQRSHWCLFITA